MRGKGIVVEIADNKNIIVMTSQGEFLRVPFRKPVYVGQEISVNLGRRLAIWQLSVAAVLFMAIVGSTNVLRGNFFIPGGNSPTVFVTLDINPSIELAVNNHQRVVDAQGLNQDGKDLLSKVKVIGKDFKQAVEIVSAQAEQDGYLVTGKNDIVVTISGNSEDSAIVLSEEDLPNDIELANREFTIQHELEETVVDTLTSVYQAKVKVWRVPGNVRQEYRQAGLTPAMYIAIHMETHETTGNQITAPTTVATSMERQGEVRRFEFQVQRPVLTPVTWTRQTVTGPALRDYNLPTQTRVKGENDRSE